MVFTDPLHLLEKKMGTRHSQQSVRIGKEQEKRNLVGTRNQRNILKHRLKLGKHALRANDRSSN